MARSLAVSGSCRHRRLGVATEAGRDGQERRCAAMRHGCTCRAGKGRQVSRSKPLPRGPAIDIGHSRRGGHSMHNHGDDHDQGRNPPQLLDLQEVHLG